MRNVYSLILIFVAFLLFSNVSLAQEITITETPTSTPAPKMVDYQLPYPGLLPDNPLYNVKAFRDKIIEFLISDPLKKSEFYLLQADKRLEAGVYLFDKGKVELAESTISKAENYFEDAITQLKKAKGEGMDIVVHAGRTVSSSQKHQEVIKTLEKKAQSNLKESFKKLRERVEKLQKDAESLAKI